VYKVVIADDEYMVKLGIRTLIEESTDRFSVVGEARNGQEAIVLVAEHHPNLLITDVRMPVMDGLELIRTIRKQGYQTDTVIVSGYSDFTYAQEALRCGAVDYLLKPFEVDGLIDVLNRLQRKWEGASPQQQPPGRAQSGPASDQVLAGGLGGDAGFIARANGTSSSWGYRHIVSEALAYIEQRYGDAEFSLKEVASAFYLSPAYFSYIFKQVTGTTFIQHLTQLRMEKAKRLLADPSYKVYAVGLAVGYPEYSHFAKMFKKYCGVTPTEYRRSRACTSQRQGECPC
jgi:two-component system response regulator YesN